VRSPPSDEPRLDSKSNSQHKDLGTADSASNQFLTLTIEVDPAFLTPDPLCSGYGNTFTNTVEVSSSQLDLNPDNNLAEQRVQLLTSSDLSISLSPANQGATPSSQAPITVTIDNDGPDDASGVSTSGTALCIDCGSAVPAFDNCGPISDSWSWGGGDSPSSSPPRTRTSEFR
jgi:hypothetical protein